MSRVSGCLWLSVALILALVAGGIAFVTIQRATGTQAAGQSPMAVTQVVVAAHPVGLGALLTDGDLTVQNMPAGAVPAGIVASISEASGHISTVPLSTGEMVLAHHLTRPDIIGANASFALPEGKIAVTLSAGDLLSNSQMVKSGDHVDILYSAKVKRQASNNGGSGGGSGQDSSDEQQYTFGALQNVEIVSVISGVLKDNQTANAGDNAAPVPSGPPQAYILALPPQDALVLKWLKDSGATIDLGLRNVTDETDHVTKPVDLKYVVDKYQLPVCQPASCQIPVR